MLVGVKIKINITNYPDRELIFFLFLLLQISSSQKTKKPLEKFVRNIKSGDVFYKNDRT